MWKSVWHALRGECGGRIGGVVFGFFCGVLYLFVGFWDMLMFALIVYAGYSIGRGIDKGRLPPDVRPLWDWLNRRWRGFK